MVAKREGDKNKDATYKLTLNSASGLLDNKHSWLYYPEGAMKMRLMGQLIMTKTIEELAIADFKVISVNTDGTEVIVPKEREQEYLNIVNNIGLFFNLDFEHDIYKKIVYKNVNNYTCINQEENIKVKGSYFITEPNLGDSCDNLIISQALENYFLYNIPPEEYITKDCHHIYKFCMSKKVDKSYNVVWGEEQLSQRLNRFYVSKKGKYLYKNRKGKSSHMLKNWGVNIYNEHEEKSIIEYNIDYRFYISETRKIINEIEIPNKIQFTLF